jgi:hypothetical protein
MPRILTLKQEKFRQQFISTGNASEAYRQSYDCSKMKNTTINRAAYGLVEKRKVSVSKAYNHDTFVLSKWSLSSNTVRHNPVDGVIAGERSIE